MLTHQDVDSDPKISIKWFIRKLAGGLFAPMWALGMGYLMKGLMT